MNSIRCRSAAGAVLLSFSVCVLLLFTSAALFWARQALLLGQADTNALQKQRLAGTAPIYLAQAIGRVLQQQNEKTDGHAQYQAKVGESTGNISVAQNWQQGSHTLHQGIIDIELAIKDDKAQVVRSSRFKITSLFQTLPERGVTYLASSSPAVVLPFLITEINQMALINALAQEIHDTCDTLSAATTGVIWVTQQCEIPSGRTIGQRDAPVFLLYTGEALSLSLGAHMFAWVYAPALEQAKFAAGSYIEGAVVIPPLVNLPSHAVRHSKSVLTTLSTLPSLYLVQRVNGSWRDF